MHPIIVFLDSSTLQATLRAPQHAYRWQSYPSTSAGEVVSRLAGAKIAVVNKVGLFAPELKLLPELEMIAVAATGTNNVDLDFCQKRGIAVCNIRNYATESVPEHVFSLILALKRNLFAYRQDLRQGLWQKSSRFCLFTHPLADIAGCTMGIIGYGAIGKKVATLGAAFGAKILVSEHKGAMRCREGYTPFDEVLEKSDILSLHCPLAPETRNLIGKDEFAKMRAESILINTARGGLVDEDALYAAISESRIGGAGFDVLLEEPPQEGSPLLSIDSPNFILTPHIAWASSRAQQKLADQLIDNIDAWLEGNPRNRVV